MIELEQGLFTRRSVRRFVKHRTIPTRTLHEILSASMHAPSARDSQCWEFIVIDKKPMLEKLKKIQPSSSAFIGDASMAVIVCGDTRKQAAKDCWIVDTSNAALQMMLACHAKGLGSCWCGIFPDKAKMHNFSVELELLPHIEPLAMIAIGYKHEEPKQPINRYDIKKIHMNRW